MFFEERQFFRGPAAFGADGEFEVGDVRTGCVECGFDALAQGGVAFVFGEQDVLCSAAECKASRQCGWFFDDGYVGAA